MTETARTSIRIKLYGSTHVDIPVETIAAFVAQEKRVAILTTGRSYEFDETIKNLKAEFGPRFVEIIRGTLVDSTKAVIDKSSVILYHGGYSQRLTISRRRVKALTAQLSGPA